VRAEPLRVLLSLLLALPFACLALLSLLAFLGVMILARMVQAIATARSVMGLKDSTRAPGTPILGRYPYRPRFRSLALGKPVDKRPLFLMRSWSSARVNDCS
jgi:hypothetical protein